ncbi:MAG: hypothetical protein LBO63_04820 [Oscillospiraceae bacterium]|jgi:hypothetical protein|nr:hypothetical protein [Oscillospiraceae bacterium]
MSDFQLVSGVHVPNLDGIHECYELQPRASAKWSGCVFNANISAEHLQPILRAFCEQLDEPCFFILETATRKDEEAALQNEPAAPLHRDVFYRNGYTRKDLRLLLETYGELLINDGMSRLGFASHVTHDEIYVGKYKIMTIFTADEQRYKRFFADFHIPQEDDIKTVWSNFTQETPGESRLITIDGKTVYDVQEGLAQDGLYFAERREES